MKRLFTTLLLVMGAFAGLHAVEVGVSTAAEFIKACNDNPSADIMLMADIDMKGQSTISKTFKGSITSNPSAESAYGFINVKNVIFAKMEGASVYRLFIRQCDMMTNDGFGAVLAKEAVSCTLSDIVMSDIHVFADEDYAAALVAKASGTSANKCVFDGIIFDNCRVNTDAQCVGLVTGSATYSDFKNCVNRYNCKVYADGTLPDAYAGAFCGYAENSSFYNCTNISMVGAAGDHVGGIVGYGKNTSIRYCINSGTLVQCDEDDFDAAYEEMLVKMKEIYGDDPLDWASVKTAIIAGSIGAVGAITAGVILGFNIGMTSVIAEALCLGGLVLGPIGIAVAVVAGIVAAIYGGIMLSEQHDELGGICGSLVGGTIEGCTNAGVCLGVDSYIGGIVGWVESGVVISNCLNAGIVNGDDNLGGIVGDLNKCTLSNCVNLGTYKGDSPQGPLTGGFDSDAVFKNNYYLGETYSKPGSAYSKDNAKIGVCQVSTTQFANGLVANWLNVGGKTNVWSQDPEYNWAPLVIENEEGPAKLTIKMDVQINTPIQFVNFASRVNNGETTLTAELCNDLDMSEVSNWAPIGTTSYPFCGIFEGNGHTISNLHCSTTTAGAGLFGMVESGACIYDVNLDNSCSITSTDFSVGSIVGRILPKYEKGFVVIDGCTSMASLEGRFNVGGILGSIRWAQANTRVDISNCGFTGKINVTGTNTDTSNGESAFICASAGKNANVKGCYSMSSMKNGNFNPGMAFARGASVTVKDCYQYVSPNPDVHTNPDFMQTGVGTFTTIDAEQGILAYKLNGNTNDSSKLIRWEHNIYNGDWYPRIAPRNEVCKGVYYTREVSNTLGTIVLPFDIASSADITFFTLTGVNETGGLNFESVDVLPAGTPAIFRTAETGTITFIGCKSDNFSYTAIDVTQSAWTMKGNFCDPGTSTVFTREDDDMSRLYYISGGQVKNAKYSLEVNPLRAYLEGPAFSGANSIVVRLDGHDATLIEWTEMDETDDILVNADAVYDLQGRRVVNPQHGIYIVGGKKVFLK